ncbi:hypothetical protein SK128_025571 [Halocaridina rubra]|uniref:Uncharacterized protein n=1 Tax=Halocaridina rubra TaxID=373956 RepID=A0AAN9A6A1_HALRR
MNELISAGAKLDTQDKYGRTALIWAVRRGHRAIIKTLLKLGANPSIRDKSGQTSLQWAIRNGDKSTIEILSRALCSVPTTHAKNNFASGTPQCTNLTHIPSLDENQKGFMSSSVTYTLKNISSDLDITTTTSEPNYPSTDTVVPFNDNSKHMASTSRTSDLSPKSLIVPDVQILAVSCLLQWQRVKSCIYL